MKDKEHRREGFSECKQNFCHLSKDKPFEAKFIIKGASFTEYRTLDRNIIPIRENSF